MACRMEQVARFGHTPQQDRQTPLYTPREFDGQGRRSFLRLIARHFSAAIEYAAFGPGKYEIVRRHLVKTAALCLAAIDRIDAELEERAPDAPQEDLPQ